MTRENFERLVRAFLKQRPFQPFTLELISGGRVEVNHPEALTVRADGLVVCKSTTHNRSIFEAGSAVRFITGTGTG